MLAITKQLQVPFKKCRYKIGKLGKFSLDVNDQIRPKNERNQHNNLVNCAAVLLVFHFKITGIRVVFRRGRALGHPLPLWSEKYENSQQKRVFYIFIILGGHSPGCRQSRIKFTKINYT